MYVGMCVCIVCMFFVFCLCVLFVCVSVLLVGYLCVALFCRVVVCMYVCCVWLPTCIVSRLSVCMCTPAAFLYVCRSFAQPLPVCIYDWISESMRPCFAVWLRV